VGIHLQSPNFAYVNKHRLTSNPNVYASSDRPSSAAMLLLESLAVIESPVAFFWFVPVGKRCVKTTDAHKKTADATGSVVGYCRQARSTMPAATIDLRTGYMIAQTMSRPLNPGPTICGVCLTT
jgi:hypothetical protein